MSQIVHNIISADEIRAFKEYYNQYSEQKYVNASSDDHKMNANEPVIDHRLLIEPEKSQYCYDIIQRITWHFLPGCTNIWANYQRQSLPHSLHVDDYCKHFDTQTYTIIIALDEFAEFNAVIFHEQAKSNDHLKQIIYDWTKSAPDLSLKVSDVSSYEDVEHTAESEHYAGSEHKLYFTDWMHLDTVFRYNAGSCVFFKADQIHCSGNWRKYNKFVNKDLVQIHAHYTKEQLNESI